MSVILDVLFHVMLVTLVVGSISGMFMGTVLVLRPGWLLYVGRFTNHWISTRSLSRLLDRMILIDRWFYRHHYASGVFLLAGAVFLFSFFTGHFDKAYKVTELSREYAISFDSVDLLMDSSVFIILLGAAFALIISMFLLIRPSMFKSIERDANQWVSLRRSLKPLEVQSFVVDEYVLQNDKMAGVVLLCGSLYASVALTILL